MNALKKASQGILFTIVSTAIVAIFILFGMGY